MVALLVLSPIFHCLAAFLISMIVVRDGKKYTFLCLTKRETGRKGQDKCDKLKVRLKLSGSESWDHEEVKRKVKEQIKLIEEVDKVERVGESEEWTMEVKTSSEEIGYNELAEEIYSNIKVLEDMTGTCCKLKVKLKMPDGVPWDFQKVKEKIEKEETLVREVKEVDGIEWVVDVTTSSEDVGFCKIADGIKDGVEVTEDLTGTWAYLDSWRKVKLVYLRILFCLTTYLVPGVLR